MKNLFIETFKNISTGSIDYFESKYNIIVPEDYKKFISNYNGGFLNENEIINNKEHISIEVFYGLQKEYLNYDLDTEFEINMYGTAEKNILIIGQCLGQNYIGISLGNKKNYKIYYINVEDYILDFDKSKVEYIVISENIEDLSKKMNKEIK